MRIAAFCVTKFEDSVLLHFGQGLHGLFRWSLSRLRPRSGPRNRRNVAMRGCQGSRLEPRENVSVQGSSHLGFRPILSKSIDGAMEQAIHKSRRTEPPEQKTKARAHQSFRIPRGVRT